MVQATSFDPHAYVMAEPAYTPNSCARPQRLSGLSLDDLLRICSSDMDILTMTSENRAPDALSSALLRRTLKC